MSFRNLLNSFVQDLQGGYGLPPQQPPPFYGYSQQIPAPTSTDIQCPRPIPQAGFTDWLVLLSCPSFPPFHVCPHCYNVQIRTTPLVTKFAPAPVPPQLQICCDISRFWVLAAGIVLHHFNQDRRLDISILPRVKSISVLDGECPNTRLQEGRTPPSVTQRTWYTIRDAQGTLPLQGWTVCMHCVVNIQTICPAIAYAFVPVAAGPVMGSCAIMPGDGVLSDRNAKLIHSFATCKDMTSQTGQLDMSNLVNTVRSNPALMPYSLCLRNVVSQSLKCHTMREISELTICEKCYSEIIQPDMQRGVDLAKRVDPTPSMFPRGFTCQLYSERMRRVWAEAAARGDIEYLRQKVTERRMKEREFQIKTTQLKNQQDQLLMQMGMTQAQGVIATEVEMGRINNNFALSQLGFYNRIDDYTVAPLDTTADLSGLQRANNQSGGIMMQGAQIDGQIKFAEEEWRRYWE